MVDAVRDLAATSVGPYRMRGWIALSLLLLLLLMMMVLLLLPACLFSMHAHMDVRKTIHDALKIMSIE